jgi:hypothetical protein
LFVFIEIGCCRYIRNFNIDAHVNSAVFIFHELPPPT